MEKHSKLRYKYCVVPMCENNTKTAPDKIYFNMPKEASVRKRWCEAMRRDSVSCLSTLYCCEDHFNIEEDTDNYIKYKLMTLEHAQKVTLRLKKGVVPYKFHCQNDLWRPPPKRMGAMKRKRQALIEETLADDALTKADPSIASIPKPGRSSISISEVDLADAGSSIVSISQADLLEAGPSTALVPYSGDDKIASTVFRSNAQCSCKYILQLNKGVQVNCKVHHRSKGINVNLTAKKSNIALSPFRMSKNSSTSPLKCAQSFVKRQLFSDNPTDIVSLSSINSHSSELSINYYQNEHISSDTSWLIEDESDSNLKFKSLMRSGTLMAIEKEPKMLLGLPKKTFYLIKLLSENIPLPTIDIFITLRKIKLNESFSLLAINFGYSQSTISRIFSKCVVAISEKIKELIYWPTPSQIFEKLPISFRARYDNVVSIIDCLEIQIEKPTNAVHQALTWSQYKKCNTLKYLISCTPDGLVNFISDGYSGRATDVMIVEDCGFLDYLPPEKAVMADRGFKDLTHLLTKKNCTLVRPPSVSQSTPSTKEDVKQSKQIAALRINVERVIGRLREFNMLLPHACIDHHLIHVMDEVIIIACGLINLQDVLIKK